VDSHHFLSEMPSPHKRHNWQHRKKIEKNNVSLRQIISKNELGLAEASLASATEAAALAKESLDEARREYKVGLVDFLQFFQVESANYEATTALLQLKYDVIGAYANYFIYSGQPLSVLIDLLAKEGNKT
jgi:hypothetical protein